MVILLSVLDIHHCIFVFLVNNSNIPRIGQNVVAGLKLKKNSARRTSEQEKTRKTLNYSIQSL